MSDTTKIEVQIHPNDTASVYGAWVAYDPEDGTIFLHEKYYSGDTSTPMDVYHNRLLILFEVHKGCSLELATTFLDSGVVKIWLSDIVKGYDVSWNGHNMVGVFSEEGTEAMELIAEKWDDIYQSQTPRWSAIDVSEWLEPNTREELLEVIGSHTTMLGAAESILDEAYTHDVILDFGSVVEYLERVAEDSE
jgi:hypothetical protein